MARIRKTLQTAGKPIWRIALYIRLSKEDGNDESLSVGNQRKILLEYVEQYFQEEYIIVDMYVDDGNTGTDTCRQGFLRMEQDIKDGKVNCVMVKALARAFRNIGDQSKFLDEFLPLYNVRFISLGSPYVDTYNDPGSAAGFEVPMYGMFNEQFAASTSEEVRKTFNTKRRKGEFIGAFAPYGYAKSPADKNCLIIDEEAAQVVRDIFTWFLYGIERPGIGTDAGEQQSSLSINGIVRELNERNIPCPAKYKQLHGMKYCNPHNKYKEVYWTHSTVARILKDRMYTGCMVQGRNRVISYKIHKQIRTPEEEWFIVENTHAAIISDETFAAAQKWFERDTRTAPGKKQVYLFAGLLYCSDCGRALHRKTSSDKVYYYCRTSKTAAQACQKRSIREDVLEKAVLEAIQAQISLVDELVRTIDTISRAPRVNNQSDRLNIMLKQQQDELAQTTRICDSLYVDWKNGDISRAEYLRMKSDYTRRREEIQTAIDKIMDDCHVNTAGITSDHPYFKEFKKYNNVKKLRRDLLVDLVDKIFVHKDGEITIRFNFADQYQRIADFLDNDERELIDGGKGQTA